MGIVIKQSLKNLVFTYIGFAIGAVNTLFLYPFFMEEEYYGLINVLLSTAMIFYPLLSFGMGNAIIRFYSGQKSKKERNRFLSFSFLFPVVIILPTVLLYESFLEYVNNSLSDKSELLKSYTSYIYILAVFIGYFEVFFAFSKVQMKSVFGNILKEVSIRVIVSVLLLLLYFGIIEEHLFVVILTVAYGVRTIIMAIYSIRISEYRFETGFYSEWKTILTFSFFIIISSSVTYILIELDKLMVSQFIDLSNVAYYAVGGFIGIVVGVPGRSMQQILAPITAKALYDGDIEEVDKLYKKSSINLLIISGFIFLLVTLNIHYLFLLLPEKFAGGEIVAQLIALAKLIDMIGGINGTIISNSRFYKVDLIFGILLIIFAVISNYIFIPIFGLPGAAIATALSTLFFNVIKLVFIKSYFHIQPFSVKTFYSILFIGLVFVSGYYLELPFGPIVSIFITSCIVVILFFSFVVLVKPSEDIDKVIYENIKKKYFNK